MLVEGNENGNWLGVSAGIRNWSLDGSVMATAANPSQRTGSERPRPGRPRRGRFSTAQHDQRETGDNVIGRQEERDHPDETLKRPSRRFRPTSRPSATF